MLQHDRDRRRERRQRCRLVLSSQSPSSSLVDAQHENGVVELARHGQRPPLIAGSVNGIRFKRLHRPSGARTVSRRRARCAIERDIDMLIVIAVVVDRALQAEFSLMPLAWRDAWMSSLSAEARARTSSGNFAGAAMSSTRPQRLGALALGAVGIGAKHVSQVATHFALVHHAGQTASAWQHSQQRNFGQAHRAGTVVN